MLYFVLQINGIQNFIAEKIKTRLEPFLGVNIQFNNISVDILNRIVVDDLTVLDHRKDTILRTKSVTFGLKNFNLTKRKIAIKIIELDQARIHFYIDSSRHLNLEYIVKRVLEGSDSTTPGWLVEFDNIGITNSRLRIEDAIKGVPPPHGVNLSDMRLNKLNIRVRDLTVWDGLCTFKVNRLAFAERSGFTLEQLTGRVNIRSNMMHFNNLSINTLNSAIIAPRAYFNFERFGNFSEFDKKVNLQFWIRESIVSIKDIAYFLPDAHGMIQKFQFAGEAKGKFSDLNCTDIIFKTGKGTYLDGNVLLKGLPDVRNVYIDLEAKKLNVLAQDIEDLYLPFPEKHHLELPRVLKNLSFVNFSGDFTGYPDNFEMKGNIETNLGSLNTNFSLRPQPGEKISISGQLNASRIHFGRLIGQEELLGAGDAFLKADLSVDGNKVSGTFNSNLKNCFVNNYIYRDIQVNGTLKANTFDGSVKVDDPNIQLSAAGYFDFSKASSTYNFSSTLYQANPFALNLTKDSIIYMSGQLMANMKGRDIDSLNGEIGVANLLLKRKNQSLAIKNIFIKSDNSSQVKGITLRSDMLTASIKGEHDLSVLPASFIQFIRNYMPETFREFSIPITQDLNRFEFDVSFKNTRDVCAFFLPGTGIALNTSLKGEYDPNRHLFSFDLKSDSLHLSKYKLRNLTMTGTSDDDTIHLQAKSGQVLIAGQISMQDMHCNITGASDTAILKTYWKDSLSHSSNLELLARVARIEKDRSVRIFEVHPSEIYLLNDLWKIQASSLVMDSTSIMIPGLTIFNNHQKIVASGTISELPDDVFSAEFSNFNLKIANFLLGLPQLKLDGKLNGKLSVSDFYHNRQLFANVDIADFSVNKELLGETSVKIKMDQSSQKLNIKAHSETRDNHFLNLSGDYTPEGEGLDFKFTVNKTGAQVLEPFIESIFDIERGNITGFGQLGGSLSYPVLNAQLDVDSASLMVKVLKTSYSFDSRIRIIDNKILLKNIKLRDAENNICKADGYIDNQYFKTFQLYITLMLDKNLVLDLKPSDEMPLYGRGYASGIVRITGNPDQVNIDIISAKTEKNTVIYLPLNQEYIASQDFITFTGKSSKEGKQGKPKPIYQVKASGLILNIDLEVSPNAEVQLVFDPALGDIMRAQGSGNLKLELDKSGNFTVRGNYVVRSGDYMFTLKNLLNKQFVIEQGGTIVFNGNPIDATLDVSALYKTRASLYNLFYEEEFKKRIPINCQLFVTGKLLNPDIRYNIALPNAADETRNKVKEAINNEQELSKQFMSLLVLNNFLPDLNKAAATGVSQNNASVIGRDAAATTSLELLSSQVSNWVSQISKDFDIGVNYRPGDKNFTNQEFEVAMSTQLLDDRVSINGNLDFIGSQANTVSTRANTSSLVGDVNVEVKVTDKIMLKAFNRSNDQLFDYNDLYTRGLGIAYREEFRNLSELRQRYYDLIFSSGKQNQPDTVKTNK